MSERLLKLRQKLAEKELDGILISQPENRRYLSGFDGSAGLLLITGSESLLATDFRYTEQAKEQAPDFQVIQTKGDMQEWFPGLVSGLNLRRLGFEADYLSLSAYQRLIEAVKTLSSQPQFAPAQDLVEQIRAIKETRELELIAGAVKLADQALEHISNFIRPGMKEKEVSWEIERFLRENGSESLPFETIVASGPRSALPHAKPTERSIQTGEPIVVDVGARLEGYCSDLTRTFYLGEADSTFARVYDIVLGAQLVALATLESGMSGEQADRLARTVIEEAGYGKDFGHSLGHGVGLAPHEEPRLAPKVSSQLIDNMVFTIEPGIYIVGWGGVRIEDMVVMEKGKPRLFSQVPKIR
jgi:Xaa-Pro aminopeptidase